MRATGGKIGEGDWIPRVESNPRTPPRCLLVSNRFFLFSKCSRTGQKELVEKKEERGKGKTRDEERRETRKWKGEKKGNVEQEIDDKKKEEE